MVASYVAWRADQGTAVVPSILTSDNVGSYAFAQDRALTGEARAKEYGRHF